MLIFSESPRDAHANAIAEDYLRRVLITPKPK
jgi:hypothetical protein